MESKKNVFLAVTGLHPQVITESLFGIIQKNMPWPDEIKIITTKQGKQSIQKGLLDLEGEGQSKLKQLCVDYGKTLPIFNLENILVVPDARGDFIDDPRNEEDQEALADFIIKVVGELCADNSVQLHASIAGGRKTMTFFLGYAMTLFARVGDKLSHVLVEQAFEGDPEFYYPTATTQWIKTRNSKIKLDSSLAKVTLVDIPFIRHRTQLHSNALENLTNESYREMTALQNLVNTEQLEIEINIAMRSVILRSLEIEREIFFDDKLNFAFLVLIGEASIENRQIERPKTGKRDMQLANSYLRSVDRIYGYHPLVCDNDDLLQYEKFNELRLDNLDKVSRTIPGLEKGMKPGFFDDRKTQLKDHLIKKLPVEIVNFIFAGFKHRLSESQNEINSIQLSFKITSPKYIAYPLATLR